MHLGVLVDKDSFHTAHDAARPLGSNRSAERARSHCGRQGILARPRVDCRLQGGALEAISYKTYGRASRSPFRRQLAIRWKFPVCGLVREEISDCAVCGKAAFGSTSHTHPQLTCRKVIVGMVPFFPVRGVESNRYPVAPARLVLMDYFSPNRPVSTLHAQEAVKSDVRYY